MLKLIENKKALLVWLIVPALAILIHPFVKANAEHLKWLSTALMLSVLFFSVVVHELAHGAAAAIGGDTTALNAGRLSFNPIRHVSVVGSVIVPLALYLFKFSVVFGWAKPVPFNPVNLRRHPRDQVFLTLAGPLSNFALAYLGFTLFLTIGFLFNRMFAQTPINFHWDIFTPLAFPDGPYLAVWFVLFQVLRFSIVINIGLGLFNLIPFPPLDGFWVLKALLPGRVAAFLGKIQMYGIILLFIALHFKLLSVILYPFVTIFGLLQMMTQACLG